MNLCASRLEGIAFVLCFCVNCFCFLSKVSKGFKKVSLWFWDVLGVCFSRDCLHASMSEGFSLAIGLVVWYDLVVLASSGWSRGVFELFEKTNKLLKDSFLNVFVVLIHAASSLHASLFDSDDSG